MPILGQWLASLATKALVAGGVLLALWLYIGHVDRSARREQKAADAAVVEKATLQAQINALEQARQIEAAQARGTKEANDALLPELTDARARLAVWMRDKANRGGAGQAGMPSTADAASLIDRADREAVMADDLRICTDNTARLVNAADWAAKNLPQ